MSIGMRNAMLAGCGSQPSGGYWGLCFTAEEPGVVVNMTKTGSPPAVTLETSPDGVTWTSFDADGGTTPITLVKFGDRVYFRAGSGGNSRLGDSSGHGYGYPYTISGRCSASGNILSLLSADNPDLVLGTSNTYAFENLFDGCTTLISAPQLPSVTLPNGCYARMFRGCSSLRVAPRINATTVNLYALREMFYNCSSLSELEVAFRSSSSWGTLRALNWLSGVSSTGTFYCPIALGTNDTITRGASACPVGWTVINTDA